MGRKLNPFKRGEVLKAIEQNDCEFKAGGIAKLLGRHPQEIVRVLTSLEDEPDKHIYEDDEGFLGIFKFW